MPCDVILQTAAIASLTCKFIPLFEHDWLLYAAVLGEGPTLTPPKPTAVNVEQVISHVIEIEHRDVDVYQYLLSMV